MFWKTKYYQYIEHNININPWSMWSRINIDNKIWRVIDEIRLFENQVSQTYDDEIVLFAGY